MIYLDANATAPLLPAARAAVLEALDAGVGNPSSVHSAGQRARALVDRARERCAAALGCAPKELVFTSGGTESDALALHGLVGAAIAQAKAANPRAGPSALPRPRLVTTAVEHPAVAGACAQLAASGVEVVKVGVDGEGRLDLDALSQALAAPGTVLCSAMAANNETGVLFPLAEIARRCRWAGVALHTDAVQLAGKARLDLRDLPVEALSLAAHKLGGPAGAGLLFVRKGVKLAARQQGGHQERGLRAGTEATAALCGMAAALEAAQASAAETAPRLKALRDRLEQAVRAIPGARVVGAGAPRVENTLCAVFEGCAGEELLLALDLAGVEVSTGSACSSGTLEPSPVLLAMGLPAALARGAVRFSLWSGNTAEEIARVAELLPGLVARLRA